MERTKVRTVSGEKDEKRRRKKQLRLSRQEQRLADRQERQQQKEKGAERKGNSQKSFDEKIKAFVLAQRRKKKKEKQEEKEFQIVLGTKHKRLLWILSILSLLLVTVIVINALVPITIWEYTQNVFAGSGTGEGFPVSVSASNTNYIVPVGSDIALLGDSALFLYKSNGKLLFQRQHGYSDPGICSSVSRVMVYDRGGNRLRIENRAKTVLTMETGGNITTAAMADNGCFAVVTRGTNYVSEVTAYNAKGEQVFVWRSAGRQVMGVTLSDNGKFMAVSTLSVENNGQEISTVLLFNVKQETPIVEEVYQGCLPYSLDWKEESVMALFSDRVSAITKEGVRTDQTFEGGTAICFDNRNTYGMVLVLGMYQDTHNNRLLVLDEQMNKLSQTELNVEVKGVSAKGNHVSVLADQQVLFFTKEGEANGEAALTTDGNYLVCKGTSAVVLGSDTLQLVSK